MQSLNVYMMFLSVLTLLLSAADVLRDDGRRIASVSPTIDVGRNVVLNLARTERVRNS